LNNYKTQKAEEQCLRYRLRWMEGTENYLHELKLREEKLNSREERISLIKEA
jgi:hypothetical protein